MGGHASQALTDLTGGIVEYIEWKPAQATDEFIDKQFAEIKHALYPDQAIITTAIQNSGESKRSDGLIAGHAYSITGALNVKVKGKRIHLLRLRNPWGEVEWNGDWSDKSKLRLPKRKHIADNDGEFWISAQDWGDRFSKYRKN